MALSREIFKQKMIEGRKNAAERRAAELANRQEAVMQRTVERREAEIKAQEEAYGGYSELSKPGLPPQPDHSGAGDQDAYNNSMPDLPRHKRNAPAQLPPNPSPPNPTGASTCSLCQGFPWINVPINIARDRFNWMTQEVARVATIMSTRESELSRRNGCSVCNGHPSLPDHWYHVKTTIDRATGVEYTLYACSQPCYIDLPRKYPQMFGLMPHGNPIP